MRAAASLEWFFVLEHGVNHCLCRLWHLKVIVLELNSVLHAIPERGVARCVNIFVFIQKEVLFAHNAAVVTNILSFPISTGECAFSAFILGDPVLEWGQFLAVRSLHLHVLLLKPSFVNLEALEFSICRSIIFKEVHMGDFTRFFINLDIFHFLLHRHAVPT